MSTEPEILSSDRPSAARTRRRLLVAGVAAAAVAVGGAVTAAAASAPSPSAPPGSPAPSASGSAAPRDDGERQHQPHLAGTVVSASGNTITITDRDGFQRTIHTTATTEYADGLTATPAAGTKVFAVGTVDSDKVSLLATRVAKLPDRPVRGDHARGPGGRHGDGPGGRHGDRPDRPSGPGSPSPGTPSPGTPSPGTPSPGTSGTPSPTPSPTG